MDLLALPRSDLSKVFFIVSHRNRTFIALSLFNTFLQIEIFCYLIRIFADIIRFSLVRFLYVFIVFQAKSVLFIVTNFLNVTGFISGYTNFVLCEEGSLTYTLLLYNVTKISELDVLGFYH